MEHLKGRVQRLTDGKFLRHLAWKLLQERRMNRNTVLLGRYHQGERRDFTKARNYHLSSILKYAFNFCPYYRRICSEKGITERTLLSDFQKIPLLDKRIIKSQENDLISSELPRLTYGKKNTGGSTGEPLQFYGSEDFDTQHQLLLYRIIGYRNGDKILAMDGSAIVPDLLEKQIFWKKKADKDVPYGSQALSSLYLSETNMDRYIEFINFFQPDIIRGYPSFIHTIAQHMTKNGLHLKHHVKGVVLTSETATPLQISAIAVAFGTRIFLQYGHTEAALFAYTIDESYEYYCSPVYGYVEILDEHGAHVEQGEVGEVVCTGFYNFAMPFIRYRTGDLAEFSCDVDGITRLKSVIGRTQDYIYDASGNKILLTALIHGQHYHAFGNIRRWQLVQDVPGRVRIFINKDQGYGLLDEEELRGTFQRVASVETEFHYVDSIPLTPRGKVKLLVQNITV